MTIIRAYILVQSTRLLGLIESQSIVWLTLVLSLTHPWMSKCDMGMGKD